MKAGDIYYIAMNGKQIEVLKPFLGENYNFNNIIDDYKLIRSLGEGGFGKVMLGKHKEKGTEVAIKYMDISENCKPVFLTF
jgi:serine/threonine protein kinase